MRYMGAKPYECTPNRRDYRNRNSHNSRPDPDDVVTPMMLTPMMCDDVFYETINI